MRARFLAPIAVAAAVWPAPGQKAAPTIVDRLSDRQLVGQRIVVGFAGQGIPDQLRTKIRNGTVSGVILFSDNYADAAGARALIRSLQSIPRRPPLRHRPLLVMIDQEGGLVKRLPGPPDYSAQQMGKRSQRFCRRQGRRTGRYLRRVGVNVNLAPVLDVARPGSAIGAQHRAFGHRAKRVRHKGVAFASGLERAGVAATGKHFPGLGAAGSDTDFAVQRINLSRRKLRRIDENPYGRFRRRHGSMVMLSTAIYPALDGKRPAALSRKVATRELRRHAGFRGVSITDALETVSARAVGGPRKLARLGARAGTDLLLYTELGDGGRARRALSAALHDGDIRRARFERSARRVLVLRRQLARG